MPHGPSDTNPCLGLAWTFDMRRMAVLVAAAWTFEEPVLLVGETGCGKTTAVQVVLNVQEVLIYFI